MNLLLLLSVFTKLFVGFLVYSIFSWFFARIQFPKSLPIVGFQKQLFAKTRASLRQFTGSLETMLEGYIKHGSTGHAFVMPDPTARPLVMLPREDITWLVTQPEHKLSHWKIRSERQAIDYLSLGIDPKGTLYWIHKMTERCLTRDALERIQAPIFEELRHSIDELIGSGDRNWKELNMHAFFTTVISRSCNRAFFGKELGTDENYLYYFHRYTSFMGASVLVLGQIPRWVIKPIVAHLLNIPIRYYKNKVLKMMLPIVKERVENVEREKLSETKSIDFISQAIRATFKDNDASVVGKNPEYLNEQLLALSFAAILPIINTAVNIFLDLAAAPPEVYSVLRAEAIQVLAEDPDMLHASSTRKLVLANSATRESSRLNPTLIRAMLRDVAAKDGVELPQGAHVPKGTLLGSPVKGLHLDEQYYPRAKEYLPWRFSGTTKQDDTDSEFAPRLDASLISDTYLAFGYGSHACPGRFFGTRVLTLLIAYITVEYDLQPSGDRPENMIFGDANIPPVWSKFKLRRKQEIDV